MPNLHDNRIDNDANNEFFAEWVNHQVQAGQMTLDEAHWMFHPEINNTAEVSL